MVFRPLDTSEADTDGNASDRYLTTEFSEEIATNRAIIKRIGLYMSSLAGGQEFTDRHIAGVVAVLFEVSPRVA